MRVRGKHLLELDLGEYAMIDGRWYACAPDRVPPVSQYTPDRFLADLSAHDVTEHDDGTITVLPSILITVFTPKPIRWHGYLKRGVWQKLPASDV